MTFAALPAGARSVEAVFPQDIHFQINAVTVQGTDGQFYVVVAVVTASPTDAAQLQSLTWVDGRGQQQRITT